MLIKYVVLDGLRTLTFGFIAATAFVVPTLLVVSTNAVAQNATAAKSSTSQAPIEFWNRVIAVQRGTFAGASSEERAVHASQRLGNMLFDQLATGRISVSWMDTDVARATQRIFSAILWIFAIVVAYPHIPGSDTEAFKGLSVFLGLVISLGSTVRRLNRMYCKGNCLIFT